VNKPWSVQVELTEGCNRLCSFCGLNGIRDKPGNFKFMTLDTAMRTAQQLAQFCPDARLEFAMHGEPLKNPNYETILGTFRHYLPKTQMQVTTNGIVLLSRMQQKLDRLFAIGVDFIVLDTYRPERDKLRAEVATLQGITVADFYDDWTPKGISPWHNHHRKVQRTVVLMDDLAARDGEVKSRTIVNHAGHNPEKGKLREPLAKTCTLPFREVAVAWNGNVNICCQDWGHDYTCGNLNRRTLQEIWTGPEFEAARAHLQNKDRNFAPCAGCDIGSGSRAGLLPKYPTLEEKDRQVARLVNRTSRADYDPRVFVKLGRKPQREDQ
jgi:radical SAM protein with 4Fe4S-binding SPASM domain